MTRFPQPYADDQENFRDLDRILIAARHELARREKAVRDARREVRRARRVLRAETRRRSAAAAVTPFRFGCAALGTIAFVAGLMMLLHGDGQAADMLSAAAAFWALAVMIPKSR